MSLEAARLSRVAPNWPRFRLKHLAVRVIGGGTPSKEVERYWTDGEIPWVSPKDMKRRYIDSAADRITPEAVRDSATSIVPPGTPLMVVRSGILKHSLPIAINTVPVALNQDMKAFILKPTLFPGFFLYWIEGQTSDLLLEWAQIGATVDNINIDRMLNARLALPDLATQKAIAAFLDAETARIDGVIENVGGQQAAKAALPGTFLALLVEKRASLITAAVTGQIDPADWRRRGEGDRRLDRIHEEMTA